VGFLLTSPNILKLKIKNVSEKSQKTFKNHKTQKISFSKKSSKKLF